MEEKNSTIREYPSISKDAILEAAKKVFLLASKDQFRIDSYRNNLEASKTKMSYFFLYTVTHQDIWSLSVEQKDNISIAKLKLIRITDFDEKNPDYLSKYNHELFWDRVDYLLGIKKDWNRCDSIDDIRGTLCDSLDMHTKIDANKNDLINNILIKDAKENQNKDALYNDILNDDIDFTLDEVKKENIESDKILDEALDKEIKELDEKVNSNIDRTLDKIQNDIIDEQINKEN